MSTWAVLFSWKVNAFPHSISLLVLYVIGNNPLAWPMQSRKHFPFLAVHWKSILFFYPSSNFWTALIKQKAWPEDPRSSFELHRLPKWLTSNQTFKMPKRPFLSKVQPLINVMMFFLPYAKQPVQFTIYKSPLYLKSLHPWFRPFKIPKNTINKTPRIGVKRLKLVLTAKIGNGWRKKN